MFLISSCNWFSPIHWSQMLSREWRCSWSSIDRWCSNCIWVINNFIAYWGEAYIGGLMVYKNHVHILWIYFRADARLASSQWETSLQRNAISHWLGANLESALCLKYYSPVRLAIKVRPIWVRWDLMAFGNQPAKPPTHIINSSPPGQYGCHFTYDIFRCILVNENFIFWLKFVL